MQAPVAPQQRSEVQTRGVIGVYKFGLRATAPTIEQSFSHRADSGFQSDNVSPHRRDVAE